MLAAIAKRFFGSANDRALKLLLSELRSRVDDAEPGREFVGSVLLVFKLRCLSEVPNNVVQTGDQNQRDDR